ncbi:hypothetical protein Tco_0311181, partial [Tanacetum coccineum]
MLPFRCISDFGGVTPTPTSKKTKVKKVVKTKTKKTPKTQPTTEDEDEAPKRARSLWTRNCFWRRLTSKYPRIQKKVRINKGILFVDSDESRCQKDVLERESRARVDLLESQKIAEDMRVLTIDTSSLDPMNAAIVKAQQARIRAKYPT